MEDSDPRAIQSLPRYGIIVSRFYLSIARNSLSQCRVSGIRKEEIRRLFSDQSEIG
jgi:hypothetical protein